MALQVGLPVALSAGLYLVLRKKIRGGSKVAEGVARGYDGSDLDLIQVADQKALAQSREILNIIAACNNTLAVEQMTKLVSYISNLAGDKLEKFLESVGRYGSMSFEDKTLLPAIWDRGMMLSENLDDGVLKQKMAGEDIFSEEERMRLAEMSLEDFSCLRRLSEAIGEGGVTMMRQALRQSFQGHREQDLEDSYREFTGLLDKVTRLI